MNRLLRTLMVLLSLLPALAHAHAVLLKSEPAAKSEIATSPQQVVLEFNENVGPIYFKVLDKSGAEMPASDFQLDGNRVVLPLTDALANGTYAVTYRVISADTHPVGGMYLFAVGEPLAEFSAAAATPQQSPWRLAVGANRAVLYATVLVAVGAVLITFLLALPGRVAAVNRRQGSIAALVAAVSFVLSISFGGAEMLAGGIGAFVSPQAWAQAIKSTLGISALLGVPGALLVGFAFRSDSPSSAALSIGAALMVASFLVTGHAATAVPVWLMAPNVAVHMLAGGLWFAALLPLIAATRQLPSGEAATVLDGFSKRAIPAVALLLLSGIVLTVVQVRDPAQMLGSDYGLRLSLKLLAVVVLLGLAALNKLRLTPALAQGVTGTAGRLLNSMRTEYLLMLAVLVAAASLTLATPPRAIGDMNAAAAAGGGMDMMSMGDGFRATWKDGDYSVDVEVTPAKPGENMIMATFRDAAGNPIAVTGSVVVMGLPAAQIEGVRVSGEPAGPEMQHFMVSETILPGDWTMTVEGFVNDFDKVMISGTVPIR